MSGRIPRRQRPPLTVGELTAWMAGADYRRSGRPATSLLTRSYAHIAETVGAEAAEALRQLGRDVFSYWFRLGYEAAGLEGVK